MHLTTINELLEVEVGDRLVEITARVTKVNKSKDGKHMFLSLTTCDGDSISLKAFSNEKERLEKIAEEGKILSFQGLRADHPYRERQYYIFEYELNFLSCSKVNLEEEDELPKNIDSFSEMEGGKIYYMTCFLIGDLLDLGDGTLGGKIVDVNAKKAEIYIKTSLLEYKNRFDKVNSGKNKKITFAGFASIARGIKINVRELSYITEIVTTDEIVPTKSLKRGNSPDSESITSKKSR